MIVLDEHEIDDDWHTDWQDGICAYEDEAGDWVVDRRVHRHPFGNEYTEILELDE